MDLINLFGNNSTDDLYHPWTFGRTLIGTILAAFTMGKVIGMIGDQMDRHVRFESFMTKRSA